MSTVTEIMEQQVVEEGLATFKYIVEKSIDAILMTDAELQIVYSNRASNQLMARNMTGQPLISLWFEKDLPLLDSIIERARVGGFFSAARLSGFHSVIDQYPDIEIVGTLAADWDREKGRQAAEEFLRANPPGTLDVIWASSGEMGLGAMLAVEAVGRQDEIKIFTNDVTPESADRMREGRLIAETHHGFPEWGWYGTKFAVMLALGQDVPHVFDIRPRTMYKDNADLFYPTPALEPIDWAAIKAGQKLPGKIVIGWAPADISGVYKTATDYFEKAAMEGREHGINVEVITRAPAKHVAFADQVAIIEDYIQHPVDVIAISAIEVEAIRRAIKKANEAGIPVIIVNQLEPIDGMEVASYIGFDNTVVGAISAYSVLDYLGGPGILGKGERVELEPGTYLDLAWWETLYKDVDLRSIGVRGRVAIIEGISGAWRGENRLLRSSGSAVYVDAITFPVRNKAGEFVGLVASFRDATQRKEAEEALRKARDELEIRVEERTAELAKANRELLAEIAERKRAEDALAEEHNLMRTVIDNVPDFIYFKDTEGRYLVSNKAFAHRVGETTPKEMVGKTVFELFPQELASQFYTDDQEVIRSGQTLLNREETYSDRTGKKVWIQTTKVPLWDSSGKVAGLVGIDREITEKKQAEEDLKKYTHKLEETNKALQDFAYIASHDLQEPLRKVKTFGDRLKSKYNDVLLDQGQDYLNRMQNAADRMQQLIDGLLSYSRLTTESIPFSFVDLKQVIHEVLSDLEIAIEEAKGSLEIGELTTIEADSLKMRQLFQNLIGNALKFQREGISPVIKIYGRFLKERRMSHEDTTFGEKLYQITVEDNGIGFDEKHLDRIFGMFQRLHGRSAYKGTGVGLAICKKIAEQHGGSVTAKSKLNEGASFIITIPAKQK